MKLGRNDPCPCGSGKKYKQCCLNAERSPAAAPAAAPADIKWHRLRGLLAGFSKNMVHFTFTTYGPHAVHEAWDEFMGGYDDVPFDPQSSFMQLFLPWFYHFWSPDPPDTSVADTALYHVIPTAAYLAANGGRLDPLLRRYLESLLVNPLTYFEVVTSIPGRGMTLRDIMTNEQHAVSERGISQGVRPGDLLIGQVGSVDGLTLLEASNAFVIPPLEKVPIIDLRALIASAEGKITRESLRDYDLEMLALFHDIADRVFDPPLPKLQNTDGDPIAPHKLIFDLDMSPQATLDALRHLTLDETDDELLEGATRDAAGRLIRVRFVWRKHGNAKHAEWTNTILGSIEIDGTRSDCRGQLHGACRHHPQGDRNRAGEGRPISCRRDLIGGKDHGRCVGGGRAAPRSCQGVQEKR